MPVLALAGAAMSAFGSKGGGAAGPSHAEGYQQNIYNAAPSNKDGLNMDHVIMGGLGLLSVALAGYILLKK